ncbi:MAG TPA: CBS domain-containing protein [Terriglobales bacterium]|nr:CBS domain-containing protein [Terriglobales bacterium]
MKVREVMTSEGLATATLDTTLTEIAQRMRDENVGAIPIVDDEDKLAGIITDRDIVVRAIAEGDNPDECTAEEILSEELHTIHPEADLEEAADLMASRQIRRLPVLEDDVIIGMISLGDLAVKSEEDEASEALEDISEGVREQAGSSSRNLRPQASRQQSSGERVAEEETEYQRHSGGTRAESALAGRTRNQSRSQQTIANEIVNAEGEEEPEFQNAGGGNARQRGNQQQPSIRGRQSESMRGRATGQERGSASRKRETQGVSNRSARQENQRQQKVTPMRAEASNSARNRGKRRAS